MPRGWPHNATARRCCSTQQLTPRETWPSTSVNKPAGTTLLNAFTLNPTLSTNCAGFKSAPCLTPQRIWALIAQGDEVLDWREMTARYPGACLHVLPGGDHALSDFDTHLPQLLDFLNLQPAP